MNPRECTRLAEVDFIQGEVNRLASASGGLTMGGDAAMRTYIAILRSKRFEDVEVELGSSILIQVVVAKQEYEAWFLAAIQSVAASRNVGEQVSRPDDPEAISGAKELLSSILSGRGSHAEVRDQPRLTAAFDLDEARRYSPSVGKMWRAIGTLIA